MFGLDFPDIVRYYKSGMLYIETGRMIKMLKMIIADDDEIIRSRLVNRIDWTAIGYEIADQAADGRELLEKTKELKPDVILTDIKMPFMSGIEFVEEIKRSQLKTEIVVITGYAEFEYVHKLLHLGVYGYILKPLDKEELKECMRKLYEKVMHSKKVEKLFKKELRSGEKTEDYTLPGPKKREFIETFLKNKQDETMVLLGAIHQDMLEKSVLPDKMQQCYMHLFNGIYRALKEEDKVDNEIKSLMLTLFEDFSELKEEQELLDFAGSLIERLFGRLCKIEDEKANIHLQKALSYIDKHFAENLTMAEVANRIGVSYGYLSYILNESVEGGFVRILRNRRMEESKKLLTQTDYKIYDIAERVGFANSRYFSTMFYADIGMTPAEYRRKNFREKDEKN